MSIALHIPGASLCKLLCMHWNAPRNEGCKDAQALLALASGEERFWYPFPSKDPCSLPDDVAYDAVFSQA